jgi:hypothetical protein
MKEQILEMKQKLIIFDEINLSEDELKAEIGMSLDEFEELIEKKFEELTQNDKEWVDKQLFEWFKGYKQFFGSSGCSLNCSSCGKHELEF